MNEGYERRTASNRKRARAQTRARILRADRIAAWASVIAIVVMLASAASAEAGSGGIGTTGSASTSSSSAATSSSRYTRLWEGFSAAEHRWAHRTSECESGQDPKAIALGGTYRGAFMFTRPAWRGAPKSPGGDPIDYPWRTQAVVAVLLKHQLGTKPWPVCG
jgi:hypothetical protein